jgi:predicted XRE-type DNA-binding protein
MSRETAEDNVGEKLDAIIRLIQDLFIVEATRAGMQQEEIRRVLGVRKTRVSSISKHIE